MNRVKWILLGGMSLRDADRGGRGVFRLCEKAAGCRWGGDPCGAHREFFTDRIRWIPARIPGADAPQFREKRTVYYFRYRFRVDGTDYTGKGPQNGKSHDGPHRRFGGRALSAGRSRRTSLGPQRRQQIQGDPSPPAQPCPPFGVLTRSRLHCRVCRSAS